MITLRTGSKKMRSLLLWGFLLAFGLTLCSCGGGTTPIPPQPGIVFTPSIVSPGVNTISIQEAGKSGSSITLAVRINTNQPVVGVSFWLTYASTLVRVTSTSEGNFLSTEGYNTAFLWSESSPGVLKISVTRLQTAGKFEGHIGQGDLFQITLTSQAQAGTTPLSFSNAAGQQPFVSNADASNIAAGFAIGGGTIQVIQ